MIKRNDKKQLYCRKCPEPIIDLINRAGGILAKTFWPVAWQRGWEWVIPEEQVIGLNTSSSSISATSAAATTVSISTSIPHFNSPTNMNINSSLSPSPQVQSVASTFTPTISEYTIMPMTASPPSCNDLIPETKDCTKDILSTRPDCIKHCDDLLINTILHVLNKQSNVRNVNKTISVLQGIGYAVNIILYKGGENNVFTMTLHIIIDGIWDIPEEKNFPLNHIHKTLQGRGWSFDFEDMVQKYPEWEVMPDALRDILKLVINGSIQTLPLKLKTYKIDILIPINDDVYMPRLRFTSLDKVNDINDDNDENRTRRTIQKLLPLFRLAGHSFLTECLIEDKKNENINRVKQAISLLNIPMDWMSNTFTTPAPGMTVLQFGQSGKIIKKMKMKYVVHPGQGSKTTGVITYTQNGWLNFWSVGLHYLSKQFPKVYTCLRLIQNLNENVEGVSIFVRPVEFQLLFFLLNHEYKVGISYIHHKVIRSIPVHTQEGNDDDKKGKTEMEEMIFYEEDGEDSDFDGAQYNSESDSEDESDNQSDEDEE